MSAEATPWRRLPPELAAAIRPELDEVVRAVVGAVAGTGAGTPTGVGTGAGPPTGVGTGARNDPENGPGRDLGRDKLAQDIRTGVRVALEGFLDLLGTDGEALSPRVREVFVGLGAAEARSGHGPESLLPALRAASRVLLRLASRTLAELRPVEVEDLIDLSGAVTTFLDGLATAAADGYTRQVRELAGEPDRRRHQLAELLLRGGGAEPAVRAAATAAGWPLPATVTPLLLPPEQARDARFRFGAEGLVVERERDVVVLLRPGPRRTRGALADALTGRAAVVGLTLPWPRLPEAVRLAELAVGLRDGRAGPGPLFTEDHLGTLGLRGDPGALAELAGRRLAPFDGLPGAQRERLLSTLASWLRHWGARGEVAAELYVHPQTVSYRMKRVRELLGTALDDPDIRFELLLALSVPGPAAPG
ncbi:MAG: helix-turn-helix domain-containing protein [Kineosporiaceae bacterium]